jgi:uncharacterized membrane protein YfcA
MIFIVLLLEAFVFSYMSTLPADPNGRLFSGIFLMLSPGIGLEILVWALPVELVIAAIALLFRWIVRELRPGSEARWPYWIAVVSGVAIGIIAGLFGAAHGEWDELF